MSNGHPTPRPFSWHGWERRRRMLNLGAICVPAGSGCRWPWLIIYGVYRQNQLKSSALPKLLHPTPQQIKTFLPPPKVLNWTGRGAFAFHSRCYNRLCQSPPPRAAPSRKKTRHATPEPTRMSITLRGARPTTGGASGPDVFESTQSRAARRGCAALRSSGDVRLL